MDRFIESIHQRLVAWGEWVEKRESGQLGYAQSRYDRLPGGGMAIGVTQDGLDFEILETEAIVQTLPQQLREMVIAFYTRIGTMESIAKDIGVGKVTLWRKIGMAQRMIQSAVEVRATVRAVKRQQIPLALDETKSV